MEKYEKFKALAEKAELTAEDKAAIMEEAGKHGIVLNKRCAACYKDAAVQIALAYKPAEAQPDAGGYELRDDIDVTLHSFKHGEFRVCKATLTKENAEKWIAAGIPLRFFKKLPENANN